MVIKTIICQLLLASIVNQAYTTIVETKGQYVYRYKCIYVVYIYCRVKCDIHMYMYTTCNSIQPVCMIYTFSIKQNQFCKFKIVCFFLFAGISVIDSEVKSVFLFSQIFLDFSPYYEVEIFLSLN